MQVRRDSIAFVIIHSKFQAQNQEKQTPMAKDENPFSFLQYMQTIQEAQKLAEDEERKGYSKKQMA